MPKGWRNTHSTISPLAHSSLHISKVDWRDIAFRLPSPEKVATAATATLMASRVLRGNPKIFDGTYTESRGFLVATQLYLTMNNVGDEAQRVNIALNHIRGERVGSWVAGKRRWLDAVSNDSALLLGQDIWSAFEDDFLMEFADPAERAKARKEIEEIKMEGVKLDAYIQDFCHLARLSLYDPDAPYVIHLFLQGLPADLVRCCVDRDLLTSFEDWVEATRKCHLKYRHILKVMTAPPLSNEEALVLKRAEETAARDPSTTTRKNGLTEQDKIRYKREGRCFRCGQQGHFSKMCPRKNRGTTSRPTRNETPSPPLTALERAWLQLRALPIEERRKYVEGIQEDRRELWNRGPNSGPTSPVRTGVAVVDDRDKDREPTSSTTSPMRPMRTGVIAVDHGDEDSESTSSPTSPMRTGVMIVDDDDDDDEAFGFWNRGPPSSPPSPVRFETTGIAIVERPWW